MALLMPNNALFGLAIQKSGAGSQYTKMVAGFEVPVTNDNSFFYYPMTDLSAGAVKLQDVLPPEIGGRALPSGAYVSGAWWEGGVSLIPRLDNRFGWILLAAMGEVSTISDVTIANVIAGLPAGTTPNCYTHVFTFDASDQYWVPYCTFRRLLPHPTAANELGEVAQDGRVRTLTIAGAGNAPVRADLDVIARQYQGDYDFEFDPSWTATYDDLDDFAVANCDGHFKVEDTDFDVTAASVTIVNQLLPPAQAMKIGSIDPIDFPVLGRVAVVTATILVSDYGLYVSTFSGAANDGATSANTTCIVYKADVDVMFASQTYIPSVGAGTEPYRIRIVSNTAQDNVAWQARPIRVQPNRPIVLQVTANILATSSGDPLRIYIQNDTTGYQL